MSDVHYVIADDAGNTIIHGDCLDVLREMPDNAVDLIVGSPPYEDARTYGIGYKLKGQDWVDWMVERMREMVRVSRGAVVMVVEGKTTKFRWSATPVLLMADLHRAGITLRKPPIYHRVGIPGSGGPDWLRNDYELCICCTSGGKLPWSDNTACGHPPKYAPGGAMSHRLKNGDRRDKWGSTRHATSMQGRKPNGDYKTPSRRASKPIRIAKKTPSQSQRECGEDGSGSYLPPCRANPGNVIHCKVGGGLMGSPLAHENEAPFPESLAERFVLSFCPPGGVVLDPFCGSGTTLSVAQKHGRRWIGIDVRESQVDVSGRRVGCPSAAKAKEGQS